MSMVLKVLDEGALVEGSTRRCTLLLPGLLLVTAWHSDNIADNSDAPDLVRRSNLELVDQMANKLLEF